MKRFHSTVWSVAAIVTSLLLAASEPARGQGGLTNVALSSHFTPDPISFVPNALACPLPLDLSVVSNAARVCDTLRLDNNGREALRRNGFVVVPWGQQTEMIAVYGALQKAGIPNFITSDFVLHLYHLQFDSLLQNIETNRFDPSLRLMSRALQEDAERQYAELSGDLNEAARRNIAYFATARQLLGEPCAIPACVAAEVEAELALVAAHGGFARSPIFIYGEDYSQYVPRGHYTRSEQLSRYFKAMMWYGRMAFLLKGGDQALVPVRDAAIQTMQASLITLGLDRLQVDGQAIGGMWNQIYAVTSFFVGLADDLTPYEYKECILDVFGPAVNPAELSDPDKLFSLKTELALRRSPRIYGGTGACEIYPPITPEKLDQVLDKTKGMRLMGQRFVPDAYMFQQLVAPAVGSFTATGTPFTMESTPAGSVRCFPRGLDVMASLGSWRALTILDQEGDTAYIGYDRNMNDLIAQFRSFDEPAWHRNLYWGWLHALQTLLAPCGGGYPPFMQQAAWQDKQLNTALASWTQLRHDTILYAKQSYTAGIISIPPPPPLPDRGYVEPIPTLLNRLLCLTRMMNRGLADMGVLSAEQQEGLLGFERILARLLQIAMAELEGRALSEPDYDYIKGLFGQDLLAAVMPIFQTATSPDARPLDVSLVADVHTDGNTGKVLEEGVGFVRVLVAAYRIPEGRVVLGVGPVFSHYEFKWPMGDRLTDEKWTNMLANGQCPPDPPWTRSFAWPVALPADDADGDRLPDAWEDEVWGSNPSVRDPNADTDGDGLTDLEEYMAGTNPRLRDSALRVTNIHLTGQAAVLYWPAVPGRRYRVFQSSDLRNWQLLGCPVSALGAACSLVDVDVSAEGQRFYRVAVLP